MGSGKFDVKRGITIFLVALLSLVCKARADAHPLVNITILQNATAQGAVCLDGSPPAYYLDRGFGSGRSNWLVLLDGGGWCDSVEYCYNKTQGKRGSSKKMNKTSDFEGILENRSKYNPEFYNWNRVRVAYCDGSSFTGDVEHVNPENKLFFRGARIFKAVMEDLLMKGMHNAKNAILTGPSAGGLATILNCDKFKSHFRDDVRVKCVADSGFFINGKTIFGILDTQDTFDKVVNLHGSAANLPPACTSVMKPSLCFFSPNVIPYVETPLFIINSQYDSYQINTTVVPKKLDLELWKNGCRHHISNCTFSQRLIIQDFGVEFLSTFKQALITPSCNKRGYFITSCLSHGFHQITDYWFSPISQRLLNKTINEAVADWYFDRAGFQVIDPYPSARDCKGVFV